MNARLAGCLLALLSAAASGCKSDKAAQGPGVDGVAGTSTSAAGTSAQPPASSSAGTGATSSAGTSASTAAGSPSAAGASGSKPPTATAGMSSPPAGGAPVTAGTAGMSAMPAAGMQSMAGAGAPATGDPAAPDPSPGCNAGSLKAGHTNETIQIGSQRRQYVQTVPSSYDGKKPFAVLLDFHGGTYDGPRWDSRASNKFHDMAETEHFIYITPTGLNQWWTTTEGADGADGMFMRALIDKLKTSGCVDNRRIYSTGCSMGGDMSFYMACYFSDVIAASLPLCGSASFNLETECKPKRPVSLTFVIGSQDTLNCWAPPRTSVGNPCATEVQAAFKKFNQCTGDPKKTHGGVCETLDQCAEGTEVTICKVNAQHTTIYTNPDIDIYKEGWEFLKRYYIH